MPTHKVLLEGVLRKCFSDRGEFLLTEVYDAAEDVHQRKSPKNKDIRATIRATLQDLRDDGVVTFVPRNTGVYTLNDSRSPQGEQVSSGSDDELEPWPCMDDEDGERVSISKEMMCEMKDIIETLRQENLKLKKQLERKEVEEIDRNKMINKARLAAQPLKKNKEGDTWFPGASVVKMGSNMGLW